MTDFFRAQLLQEDLSDYLIDPNILTIGDDVQDTDIRSELILDALIQRVAYKNSIFAERLMKAKDQLAEWTDLPEDETLELILDFGERPSLDPNNQSLVQVIKRDHEQLLRDLYLWNKMDALNRAIAKLHERVYALSSHKNSVLIQRFVALVIGHKFEDMSYQEFNYLIADTFDMKYLLKKAQAEEIDLSKFNAIVSDFQVSGAFEKLDLKLYLGETLQFEEPTQKGFASKKSRCGFVEEINQSSSPINYWWTEIKKRKPEVKHQKVQLNEIDVERYLSSINELKSFYRIRFPGFLYPVLRFRTLICLGKKGKGRLEYLRLFAFHNLSKNYQAYLHAKGRADRYAYDRKIQMYEKQYDLYSKKYPDPDCSTPEACEYARSTLLLSMQLINNRITDLEFTKAHLSAASVIITAPNTTANKSIGVIGLRFFKLNGQSQSEDFRKNKDNFDSQSLNLINGIKK